MKYGLLYGGSATAVLIVVIVVLLMIQKSISGGPVRVFEQYQQAVNDQDFGRIYDLVDDDTRHTLDLHAAEQAENFGFRSQLKGREKFIEISKYSLENSESIRVKLKEKSDATVNAKIRNQTLNGQTATLTVEFPDGKTEFIEVQKIDGQWRLGFSSVSRLFVIF